jgi:arylsulfatase A-like enzyme
LEAEEANMGPKPWCVLVRWAGAAALLAALGVAQARAAAVEKPNIVVIYLDDIGNADIGAQGGTDIPTPHIDSIARGGVRCRHGYVTAPYCSPSRSGLMTGRYQTRFGHEYNEGPRDTLDVFGLPLSETTLAQRLKALGYAAAAVGKWHLGYTAERQPTNRGFDEFYGTVGNTPYFHPRLIDSRISIEAKPVEDAAFYTTEAYAERAVQFIAAHKRKGKDAPFFLYLPFNACHVPPEATEKYLARFPNIASPARRTYAAIMSALDDAVGRVLEALRAGGFEDNTLLFCISDNGGPLTKRGPNGSNNGPLRGQKGDTWEGGIRVPFFVRWKGHLPAGKVYDEMVAQIDVLPTALAAAGAEVDPAWKLDGVNLLPYLEGKNPGNPHAALYWRFGPQRAITSDGWKLVQGYDYTGPDQSTNSVAYTRVTPLMLFHLAEDPNETTDLAAQYPERVRALDAQWQAWNREQAQPLWLPVGPRPE